MKRQLARVRRLYRSVTELQEIAMRARRLERENRLVGLSPVERHVLLCSVSSEAGLFHESYDDWRAARINKILELYGVDWFPGKQVLELGGGHGDIGAFFADLGADVLCLEGRPENAIIAQLKHRDVPRFTCRNVDLEEDFGEIRGFDLVINMGLVYHLRNVEQHLRRCFSMADEVILETAVCDSRDPHLVLFVTEDARVNEEALRGTGCRPSPYYVERIASECGLATQRCFSRDLNTGPQFNYDWVHADDGRAPEDMSLRRFWRFSRTAALPAGKERKR